MKENKRERMRAARRGPAPAAVWEPGPVSERANTRISSHVQGI